jgi:hypothetical protein
MFTLTIIVPMTEFFRDPNRIFSAKTLPISLTGESNLAFYSSNIVGLYYES